jgi:hypothetical protein
LREIFLKVEKENMQKIQAYTKFMGQNEKLNKIYFVMLAAGLFLTGLGMEEIEIAILSEL